MRSTAEDVHMTSLSEPDLNQLFAAALEFGSNWRKPVGELASTNFPEQPQEYRDAVAAAVEEARSATEEYVEATHVRLAGRWPEVTIGRQAPGSRIAFPG
jgi:hypothetical protein